MDQHHIDEKKPAQGGVGGQRGGGRQRPVLPSSRRCAWRGPETDQERWAAKEKLEEVLGRIDAMFWALDCPEGAESHERRLEILRHFIVSGMHRALELETLLFDRDPQDVPRQMETLAFDSFHSR